MLPTDNYVLLSFRTKRYADPAHVFGRVIGEGVYVATTSNFRWPDGVTYPQMKRVSKQFFKNHSR